MTKEEYLEKKNTVNNEILNKKNQISSSKQRIIEEHIHLKQLNNELSGIKQKKKLLKRKYKNESKNY